MSVEIRFVQITPERHKELRYSLYGSYGGTADDVALVRQRMNQFEHAFVTRWITDQQEERWQPITEWLVEQFGPTSTYNPVCWARVQWYLFIREPKDALAFKMRWC